MKNLILLALSTLLFLSCSKDRLTANGDKITETRNPGEFKGVSISGSTDAHITYGNEFKVVLRGSSNLIPRFESKIRSGILYLEYEHVNVKHDDIEIYVTMPLVERLAISGSGEIDVEGDFPPSDKLRVLVSGSGSVELDRPLTVDQTSVDISGSGNADLEKLQTKTADVDVSGSGDVKIKVQNNLKARISGSGKIYYLGSPVVDSSISGSGKVIKL